MIGYYGAYGSDIVAKVAAELGTRIELILARASLLQHSPSAWQCHLHRRNSPNLKVIFTPLKRSRMLGSLTDMGSYNPSFLEPVVRKGLDIYGYFYDICKNHSLK